MTTAGDRTVILIVLDSVGCGALPDAAIYGDEGADTLGHVARVSGGLHLPFMQALGLGNLHSIEGVPPAASPRALFGRMSEASIGKDTTTGHWELAGLVLEKPFALFPHGFAREITDELERLTGRGILGNRAASGTEIIEELGPEHMATGKLIVYTSADSVLQIAAHERIVPVGELYAACVAARGLCDGLDVARVIARPFVGDPGAFRRTYNRRDFSMKPPAPTMLDMLLAAGVDVTAVGKIEDIFAGQGIARSVHTEGNDDGMRKTLGIVSAGAPGLVFVNLVDFDMLYGHRNDVAGYARALEAVDAFFPFLEAILGPEDRVIVTADHGCDPTWPGTDHTREYVPVLVFGPGLTGKDVGLRATFADVACTVLALFGLAPMPRGTVIDGALS